MSNKQTINIGNQSNDGTGDSIRDAFNKVNQNFDIVFPALGIGSGLRFTSLDDTPSSLRVSTNTNQLVMITVDPLHHLTLTQTVLVGGQGISLVYDTTASTLTLNNTASSLYSDPHPTLSANLSGNSTTGSDGFRAVNFADPQNNLDLVTQEWVYNNFLNRDAVYVSSPGGLSPTVTTQEGSTLRHNLQVSLSSPNAGFNAGKTILIYDALGNTATVDLTQQGTLTNHLVRKDYADTKISLQGINTIDPATGQVNAGFGQMTGPLQLYRDPIDTDSPLTAATKNYVDNNGYWSAGNLFITTKGSDYQPTIPAYKRGRFYQYAFATVNRAAQYAEKLIATSKIEVGDYARLITHDGGTACTVASVTDNYGGGPLTQIILNAGGNGSDQFGSVVAGQYTIFPGQYVQGVDSGAIGLIESISRGVGGQEIYNVAYVDYAINFATDIKVTSTDSVSQATFTFLNNEMVPIPQFWVGYRFSYVVGGVTTFGTIVSIGSQADVAGNYSDYFVVSFSSTPPTLNTVFTQGNWHVDAGDFTIGETVVYNTNVSALQISLIVESGEYYEQYPIKLPANVSIKGDEFRRVIIRPSKGISSSPWANTYFRRDTQIDGLQTTELNTSTDYASTGTLIGATVTPGGTSGVATFTVNGGTMNLGYKGFLFVGNGGQGVITSVTSSSFTVNIGTNLTSANTIAAGSWHLYQPVNFGYHYLRNPLQPINVLTTQTNSGALVNASALLAANKTFIQSEVVAWMNAQIAANVSNSGSPWFGYTFNTSTCYRDVGTFVDSIVSDMQVGGSGNTIRSADFVAKVPSLSTSTSQCYQGINYINTLGQAILTNTTATTYGSVSQVFNRKIASETAAPAILQDLVQAAVRIVRLDPAFNPPKLNGEMDVFLCNDANVIRFVSCQNHGGFMMVLDPVGQIKNKSPYAQTNSSFSQSIAKHAFRGGMFVDGFAGNIQVYPTTSTFVNPLLLTVKGLVRKPQVPTFFINNGIRYEVDFFSNFAVDPTNTSTYTATLNLNPLTPGGIKNIIIVSDTVGGFKANQSNIPISIDQPSGVGGVVATGHAVSNSSGKITSIVIDFPGTGYINTPNITIGGAVINNLQFNNGAISGATIAYGGTGYAVGGTINFVPIGTTSVTTATATITSVDSNGAITGISISTPGTNWTSSIQYQVTFGTLSITNINVVAGFIDTIPVDPLTGNLKAFELITAGNRSMLAADFTQVNDLGYGIFVTNGSFAENVSMFTYYCYRSYYSLNGAQVRSTSGSSCYGEYGLCAEGSDPTEVPTAVTLSYPLSQVATAYVSGAYFANSGQQFIYAVIDLNNGGYPPLGNSQAEINHNGVIQTYNIGSANILLDSSNNPVYANGDSSKPVYQLMFNSGSISTQGLISTVSNGTPITIRVQSEFKFNGLNPATISRPSTALTFNDDSNEVYHVTDYSAIQADGSVIAYTLEDYFFISAQATEQGITYPIITNSGTSYTTATITIGSGSVSTISTSTSAASSTGSTLLTVISTASIVVGQVVSGSGFIVSGTTVNYVDTSSNIVGLNTPVSGVINAGTSLTFSGINPTASPVISNGHISGINITEAGTGWTSTTTTISISGNGSSAAVTSPIKLAGVIGSITIKISPLTSSQAARIQNGISTSNYYQFGINGQILNVVAYRSTSVTGQSWEEIDVDQPLTSAVAQGTAISIGLPRNGKGSITTRISLLRVSGHDFVDIGTGGYATTRIPNDLYGPPIQGPFPSQEIAEIGTARVYYATTDQDGNFRIGNAFTVNQSKGTVSINAPISLQNLTSISLKRDLGPAITEFSTDNTMNSLADYKVPTEQAVVNYISRRLGIDQNGRVYSGSILGGGVLALNGNVPMAGALNAGGYNVYNVAAPRLGSGNDATNKSYVDQKVGLKGTLSTDVDGTTNASTWGVMTGPLQLSGDPQVLTTTTTVTANAGGNSLTLGYVPGSYLGLSVYATNLATGTYISSIISNTVIGLTAPGYSYPILGTISSGTVLTLDPVVQAATKKYVDKNSQFNQLNDVSLTSPTDKDLVMFNSTVLTPHSATTNSEAVYYTATQVVNVSLDTTTITNTSSTNSGGSDVSFTRTGNSLKIKLVGGQGSNNPITDYHINASAAIQQSKLSLNKASTSASATGNQSDLGVAQFDNSIFNATTGWISLANATSSSTGVAPSKMQWISSNLGGLLGNTTNGAATYVSSSSIRTWLQVLGIEGGTINGAFTITGIATLGSDANVSGALKVVGNGVVFGNLGVGGNLTTTGTAYISGNTTIGGTITSTGSITANNGITVSAGGIAVTGNSTFYNPVTFSQPVTFNGTATYVNSTNTVYTDNILELHVPPGGVGGVWNSNDGKDIGLRMHYYNGGDQNSALVLANDTKYLEWYVTGAESNSGTFTGAVYGTFQTGGIVLTNTAASITSVVGNSMQLAGGLGVTGSVYAGDIYMNGSKVVTQATVPSSGVLYFKTDLSGLTPSVNTSGTVNLSGTLGAGSGGTGVAGTITGVAYANGSSAYSAATPSQLVAAIGSTYVANATYATSAGSANSAGSVSNALTFNNSGSGDASGTTFNGSVAHTISYNSIGASPLAGSSSITTVGTISAGTWNGSIIDASHGGTGVAGTITGLAYANGSSAYSAATAAQIVAAIGSTYVANATYATSAGSASSANSVSGSNVSGAVASATLAIKASTLAAGGGDGTAMTFNWSGQSGQPTWLWGGNDGANMYVYNPSNFSVNYATSAGTAGSATSAGTATNLSGGSVNATTGNFSGTVTAADFIATSDRRLKSNIVAIDGALKLVTQMRGTKFNKVGSDKVNIGLIAQEVQEVAPELVHENTDGYLGVAYGNVVALLIEAIKELKSEVDELKSKLGQ